MENLWQFATPKYLRAGKGSSFELNKYLDEYGVSKVFVVIDPNLAETNKIALKAVEGLGQKVKLFSSFTTNPTTDQVNNAVSQFLEFSPDGVVAIGGGSAIDLTKATILTALNGGKIEDYLAGRKGNRDFPPFIILPTTCGTGSEASPYAVITDKKLLKKRGIEDRNFLPKLVIMDTQLLASLDQTMVAATAVDALAHVTESFISKKANEITRSSARGLFIDLIKRIEDATFNKNEKALESLLNTAFASRLLYPRTGLSIAHALSHPLGAHTGIHHGLAVSYFIPITFDLNYPFCETEIREAFKLMGFTSKENFQEWFKDFCIRSGIKEAINNQLDAINLPVEVMAKDAMESSNIPSNPMPVNQAVLVKVIKDSTKYWK